jgi:hypothetical protein
MSDVDVPGTREQRGNPLKVRATSAAVLANSLEALFCFRFWGVPAGSE